MPKRTPAQLVELALSAWGYAKLEDGTYVDSQTGAKLVKPLHMNDWPLLSTWSELATAQVFLIDALACASTCKS